MSIYYSSEKNTAGSGGGYPRREEKESKTVKVIGNQLRISSKQNQQQNKGESKLLKSLHREYAKKIEISNSKSVKTPTGYRGYKNSLGAPYDAF
jgi:hypothetical protein